MEKPPSFRWLFFCTFNKIKQKNCILLPLNKLNMKKLLPIFLCSYFTVSAQTYTISNWYNDKKACAVLTYDDWLEGHGPIAVPQLVERNMVGSFYVNTDWANRGGGYAQMNYAISKGIEIGNHTVSHEDLALIPLQTAAEQINNAADTLLKYTTNQNGLTFAYPFGSYNANVINTVKSKHFASRSVWGSWFWLSQWRYNFLNTNSGAINPYHEITTYGIGTSHTHVAVSAQMSNALSNGGLITFMLHEIYNDSIGNDTTGFDRIDETAHGALLDLIKSYENDFWIATFMDAMKYHKERHCATLSTLSDSNTEWVLKLTDTLSNNTVFSHPLSINLTVPSNLQILDVQQNGQSIVYSKIGTKLTFNAVPDAGDVKIIKDSPLGISTLEEGGLIKELYPNPATESLRLTLNESARNCSIKIYEQNGSLIESRNVYLEGFTLIDFDLSTLSNGVYLFQISTENQSESRKIIVLK